MQGRPHVPHREVEHAPREDQRALVAGARVAEPALDGVHVIDAVQEAQAVPLGVLRVGEHAVAQRPEVRALGADRERGLEPVGHLVRVEVVVVRPEQVVDAPGVRDRILEHRAMGRAEQRAQVRIGFDLLGELVEAAIRGAPPDLGGRAAERHRPAREQLFVDALEVDALERVPVDGVRRRVARRAVEIDLAGPERAERLVVDGPDDREREEARAGERCAAKRATAIGRHAVYELALLLRLWVRSVFWRARSRARAELPRAALRTASSPPSHPAISNRSARRARRRAPVALDP